MNTPSDLNNPLFYDVYVYKRKCIEWLLDMISLEIQIAYCAIVAGGHEASTVQPYTPN